MRLFLKKIILFILLLIPVLIVLSYINHTRYKQQVAGEEASFTCPVSVLLLGDSHAACGVDPAFFPEMLNRAASAECLYYSNWKNKYYSRREKIQTCILSFHYFSLSKHWEEGVTGVLRDEQLQKYAHLCFLNPSGNTPETCFQSPVEYSKHILLSACHLPVSQSINQSLLSLFKKQDEHPLFGGYTPYYSTNIGNPRLCRDKLKEAIFSGQTDSSRFNLRAHISDLMLQNLEEIIKDNQQKGVKTILLNLPCHSHFNEQIPQTLKHHIDSIAQSYKENDCTYLNLSNYPLPDSCFRDYDHLNSAGAEIITPVIRSFVFKQ